jgi:hypothetical protein
MGLVTALKRARRKARKRKQARRDAQAGLAIESVSPGTIITNCRTQIVATLKNCGSVSSVQGVKLGHARLCDVTFANGQVTATYRGNYIRRAGEFTLRVDVAIRFGPGILDIRVITLELKKAILVQL